MHNSQQTYKSSRTSGDNRKNTCWRSAKGRLTQDLWRLKQLIEEGVTYTDKKSGARVTKQIQAENFFTQ